MSDDKKHGVQGSIKVFTLSKAGSAITLEIVADGIKLGTMEIGQGSFGWKGANKRKIKRKDWSAFAKAMNGIFHNGR